MTAVSEAEIRIEINGLRFIGKTQIWEFIDLIIRVYLLKLHTDCHLLPRSIRNQRESLFITILRVADQAESTCFS